MQLKEKYKEWLRTNLFERTNRNVYADFNAFKKSSSYEALVDFNKRTKYVKPIDIARRIRGR